MPWESCTWDWSPWLDCGETEKYKINNSFSAASRWLREELFDSTTSILIFRKSTIGTIKITRVVTPGPPSIKITCNKNYHQVDTICSARKATQSFLTFGYSLLQSFKIQQNLLFFKAEYYSWVFQPCWMDSVTIVHANSVTISCHHLWPHVMEIEIKEGILTVHMAD